MVLSDGLSKFVSAWEMICRWLVIFSSLPFSTEFSYRRSRCMRTSSLYSAILLALSRICPHSNSAAESQLDSVRVWCFCSISSLRTICSSSSLATNFSSSALTRVSLFAARGDVHAALRGGVLQMIESGVAVGVHTIAGPANISPKGTRTERLSQFQLEVAVQQVSFIAHIHCRDANYASAR